jgi:hypothetical protein
MRKHRLAVMTTPDRPLVINTAWNTERCDNFFRSLFPEVFNHADRHPPKADPNAPLEEQQQQWLGVIKHYQTVTLASEAVPTGADLAVHARKQGHGVAMRVLFIGVCSPISIHLI